MEQFYGPAPPVTRWGVGDGIGIGQHHDDDGSGAPP
eukprot:SAG25_NODE_4938_length_727_cov_20.385350_1_plen_35_part_10